MNLLVWCDIKLRSGGKLKNLMGQAVIQIYLMEQFFTPNSVKIWRAAAPSTLLVLQTYDMMCPSLSK